MPKASFALLGPCILGIVEQGIEQELGQSFNLPEPDFSFSKIAIEPILENC